jgi:hypothetical protein
MLTLIEIYIYQVENISQRLALAFGGGVSTLAILF